MSKTYPPPYVQEIWPPLPRNIPPTLSELVKHLADRCINKCEAKIAELYPENPQAVYEAMYTVGSEATAMLNIGNLLEPINLN